MNYASVMLLGAAASLSACNSAADVENRTVTVDLEGKPGEPLPEPPPPLSDRSIASPTPAPFPSPLSAEAQGGAQGARKMILTWARAMETRELAKAWQMMAPAMGETGDEASFAQNLSRLSDLSVSMSGGQIEGAAGSLYYTEAVTIRGHDASGRSVEYSGTVTLRRANDIPGASPEDLRWHFERTQIDWQP